ncbi:MAG: T9SS type A sorting domain-containing protein [Chitinophagales bacterium]|nr:T9SS type A sorting domain-containing protein [Chitinophagales bacterium]
MNSLFTYIIKKLLSVLPLLGLVVINPAISYNQTDSVCRDITVVLNENGEANILPIQLVDVTFYPGNQSFPPNARCDWSVAGDFNGDEKLDFTIAVRNASGIVAINQGGGFFNTTSFAIAELNGYHLAEDLDGDGDLDIALINAGEIAEGFVKIYLNDGNANFSSTGQSLGLGQKLGIADVDNDSDLDIIVSNDQEPNKIWLNNGSASFVYSGNNIGGAVNSIGISMADLDNDGDIDAVKPENIWLNDGSGKFNLGQNLSGAANSVVSSDLNQDGSIDIATSNGEIFINDGSGNFSLYHTITYTSGFGDDVVSFDLDRDGDQDLVFSNKGLTIPNTLWLNDGNGLFIDFQVLGTGSNNTVSPGELTGDRNIDLFFPDSRTGANNAAWISTTVIEEFCPVAGVDTFVQGLIDSLDWISKSSFDCNDIGSLAVTLQVPPLSGCTLSTNCISNITIEDRLPPQIVCTDTILLIETGQSRQISADDITAGSWDNCSIISRTLSKDLFTNSDLGVNIETATITDQVGNTNSCSFKVIVVEIDMQASDVISDAYIDLNWSIPVDCYLNAGGQSLYLEIKRLDTDQEVYSETIDDVNLFSQTTGYYSSSYKHLVGPDQSIDYELNLYIIGFGLPICESPTDQGSTDAFRQPFVTATDTNLASVKLDIVNHSDLLSYYKIYRNGLSIVNLTGDSVAIYLDKVVFNSSVSIKNGNFYQYCINIYNEDLQQEYGPVCDTGRTFDINFSATDLLYQDRIELSWDNISQYADNIRISKDNDVIDLLPGNAVSYTDLNVIPGQNHIYGITAIYGTQETDIDQDAGSTPANGGISGNIYTLQGNFAISNVMIEARSVVSGDTIVDTAVSDLNGYYKFDSLFYSTAAQFRLTVLDSTLLFEKNPKGIHLSLANPRKSNVDFNELSELLVDTLPLQISISDLQANPVIGQDRIDLSVTYNAPGDTVWFQLFRLHTDSTEKYKELISLSNSIDNTFPISDLSGIPGVLYNYELTAYAYEEGLIRTVTVSDSAVYPDVTTPDILTVNPYFLLGTAQLNFSQSSSNIDGMNIFRNGTLAESVDATDITYMDFGGEPGTSTSYNLSAFRNVEGVQYESSSLSTGPISYPGLLPVNFKGHAISAIPHHIELLWTYPLSLEFNYTGFLILRRLSSDTVFAEIARIQKEYLDGINGQYSYLDKTVIPSTTYDYKIAIFNEDNDLITLQESPIIPSITASVIPPVDSVKASDAKHPDRISVRWFFPYNPGLLETDIEFLILRNGVQIAKVPYNHVHKYVDYINVSQSGNSQYQYEVITSLVRSGNTYNSASVSDSGSIISNSYLTQKVSNFKASSGYSDYVRLSWEYPNYITKATFFLIRDSVDVLSLQAGVDSLPNPQRLFYDTEASPGPHVYQIRAFIGDSLPNGIIPGYSQVQTAIGQKLSRNVIRGVVSAVEDKQGVAGVKISAYSPPSYNGTPFEDYTYTDGNGFYEFPNIDYGYKAGDTLFLKATKLNSNIVPNVKAVVFSHTSQVYSVNFDDYANKTVEDDDSIANPLGVKFVSNPVTGNVEISWEASNSNYTGFFIHRGLGEIDLVDKKDIKFVIDSMGLPGTNYLYSVTTVWQVNDSTFLISEPVSDSTRFPEIEPVSEFFVVPSFLNNYVTINWGHTNNNVDGFEIRRINDVIADIPVGALPEYIDLDGIPGYEYEYSIVPYKNTEFGIAYADETAKTISYPDLTRAQNFVVSGITNGLDLKWALTANNFDGFNLYRDQGFLNRIDRDDIQNECYNYLDFEGIPGDLDTITIRTFVERDGITFESSPKSVFTQYPYVEPVNPINLSLQSNDSAQTVTVSWSYPDTNGISGFYVYRGLTSDTINPDSLIADLSFESSWVNTVFIAPIFIKSGPCDYLIKTAVFEFQYVNGDKSSIPETEYAYTLVPYSVKDDSIHTPIEQNAQKSIIYPKIPPPFASSFTNNSTYHVVTWNHDWPDVDAFELIYFTDFGDVTTFVIPGSDQKFINLDIETSGSPSFYGYKIRAIQESGPYYSNFDTSNIAFGDPNLAVVGNVPNVEATDGIGANVTINWTFDVQPTSTPVYKVFRDGVLLNAVSINTNAQSAIDPTAFPGKEYVYEVEAVVGGVTSSRNGDIGYAKPDGVISGQVNVAGNSQGVPNVLITATAFIDNKWYTYQTTSIDNGSGDFAFSDVYYGENGSTYTLKAYKENCNIVGENGGPYNYSNLVPGTGLNVDNSVIFLDSTVYILSGYVSQNISDCILPGIEVKLSTFFGSDTLVSTKKTDANGFYSFILDTYLPNVSKYVVEVADTQLIGEIPEQVRILHDFYPQSLSGDKSRYEILFDDLERVNERNFEDHLAYAVLINTKTVCGTINESFKIRIRSDNNCFDLTLNSVAQGGQSVAVLPPQNYQITIYDVNNPTPQNVVIKDYYQKRPQKLDLLDLHNRRLIEGNEMITLQEISELSTTNFTYHKTPIITEEFVEGKESYCGSIAASIILQKKRVRMNFNVQEIFNNNPCDVDEGELRIINEAATFPDRIRTYKYNQNINGFDEYEFVAGEPNMIAPYKKALTVQYYSKGELLQQVVLPIIILGEADIPGNDVIVDPSPPSVQLPLYILRDPPGDNSYSTLLENETVKKSVILTRTGSESGGFISSGEFTTPVAGVFFDLSLTGGDATSKSSSFELELSTTTEISTSEDPDHVGEAADIIVGAGMATQYGFKQILDIDPATCKFKKELELGLSVNSIGTTWLYTVEQIEALIDQYENNIDSLDAGTFSLKGEEPEDAKDRFKVYIKNWNSILSYHREKLVPHYQLCDRSSDGGYDLTDIQFVSWADDLGIDENDGDGFIDNLGIIDLLESVGSNETNAGLPVSSDVAAFVNGYKNKINDALDKFCPKVFDKTKNELIKDPQYPNKNKFWTSDIADSYNAIQNYLASIRKGFLNNDPPDIVQGFDSTNNQIIYDNAYKLLFPSDASNYTVGGGTSWFEEVAVGYTKAGSLSQTSYFNFKLSGGLAFGSSSDAGLGVATRLYENNISIGGEVDLLYEIGQEATSELTTSKTSSYTLSDDDIGDQVSVTVIRGPDQNQTPYFQLFGGRSSCPYEEGTIARDDPKLNLVDALGNVVSPEQLLVPDGGLADFPLQVGNNNPFGETRDYDVFLDPQSNGNAALVKLNGNQIGNLSLGGIDPANPLYTLLTVEQGPIAYKHNNLKIGVTPSCPEDDRILDTRDITVHFIEPCPDIYIATPNNTAATNGWVMNKGEQNLIVYQDFDTTRSTYVETSLEARRVGTNLWDDFVTLDGLSYDTTYLKEFAKNNNGNIPSFVVSIGNHPNITDGDYELRLKMLCKKPLRETFSNTITGTIDRTSPFLIGNTLPKDGVFSQYDEISAEFNENLDCSKYYGNSLGSFTVFNVTQGVNVSGFVGCFNNKLEFTITDPLVNNGDSLVATIQDFEDMYSNAIENPIVWDFIYMPLPPTPCDPPFTIFTSNITATSAVLNGVSSSNGQDYTIIGGISGSTDTVQITTNGSFSQFTFNANGLSPNTTYWWSVQTICDQSNSVYYSPFNVFTTLPECNAPLTLSHSSVTATSANISWTPVPTALGFEIQGREKDDLFRIAKIAVAAGTSSFNANGLNPNTTYEWSVRALCPVIGYTPLTAPFDTFKTDTLVAGQMLKGGEELKDFEVIVAPNPTEDKFVVQIENRQNQQLEIKVYDVVGRLLFRQESTASYLTEKIDISDKPAGMYMVTVQMGDRKQSVRIVKQGKGY